MVAMIQAIFLNLLTPVMELPCLSLSKRHYRLSRVFKDYGTGLPIQLISS